MHLFVCLLLYAEDVVIQMACGSLVWSVNNSLSNGSGVIAYTFWEEPDKITTTNKTTSSYGQRLSESLVEVARLFPVPPNQQRH